MTQDETLELEANILGLKAEIATNKRNGTHAVLIALVLAIVTFCSFNPTPVISFVLGIICLIIAYKLFYKVTFDVEVLKSLEKSDLEFFV